MNHSKWAAGAAAILVTSAVSTSLAFENETIPVVPAGVMSASPQVVQTGTYPTLTWSIVYPSKVSDVATITPPGTITLTEEPMYVSVRPIGVGVTECGSGSDNDTIPAEIRISVNGGSYDQLFYGTQDDVDPAYSLYIKKHKAGETLDFGGRYVKNGSWTRFFTTRSSNQQVIALVDGDAVPTTFDLIQSGKVAEYLKPYIDGSGKVDIGPLSVLILAEYASTDHSQGCFDYQDMALLVSFSTNHPNNGHGNNLDGVDVSNPGQGSGGPNGEIDPSGGVDDEIR